VPRRPSSVVPRGTSRSEHVDPHATLHRLKRVALAVTVAILGAFAALVVGHPVGTANGVTATPATAAGGSSVGSTQIDPFFQAANSVQAPILGSGGAGPAPMLVSGGS
jgi:uncharacterized protein YcfJ